MLLPEKHRPFGSVMLNGVQLLRCTMPMDVNERDDAVADASHDLREAIAQSSNLMTAVFLSPNIVPHDNLQWQATLRIDGSLDIDLGCIKNRREHPSLTVELPQPPTTLVLTVECTVIDTSMHITTEAENDLIQRVKEILEDDGFNPRRGALPSRLVEQQAMLSPAYAKVIGPIASSWTEFIQRHRTVFNCFQYTEQEIKDRGMGEIGMIDELRIVLRPQERIHLSEQETAVEERLKKYLKSLLVDGDMESHEILTNLSSDPEFVFYLAPSFSLLMRFLNRHRDSFSWTTDPGSPTRVSLVDTPLEGRQGKEKGRRTYPKKAGQTQQLQHQHRQRVQNSSCPSPHHHYQHQLQRQHQHQHWTSYTQQHQQPVLLDPTEFP